MPYLFPTGTWIYGQIATLSRFRPIVITNYTRNVKDFPLSPIYARETLPSMLEFADRAMFRILRRSPYWEGAMKGERTTLLHSHFGDVGYRNRRLAEALAIPHVVTFYGYDVNRLPVSDPAWRVRLRSLFAQAQLFLAEGSHMCQALVDLGCPPEKVRVQHLGIPHGEFPFKARSPGPDGKVRLLVAGTFREKKGIPFALEAFARVRAIHPELELILIGDSTGSPAEEEEKRRIFKVIEDFRLAEVVDWRGFRSYGELRAAMLESHVFLSPSVVAADGDTEGGAPVTILEAQATGMPVVSTTHCDIPEITRPGASALLVPERNVEALADALGRVVAAPETWEGMGRQGREHVEAEYDLAVQATRLERHYANLVGLQ